MKKQKAIIRGFSNTFITDSLVDDGDGMFEMPCDVVQIPVYVEHMPIVKDIIDHHALGTGMIYDHHGILGTAYILSVAEYYEIKRIMDLVSYDVRQQLADVGLRITYSGVL